MSFEIGTNEVSNLSRAAIAAVDEIRQERLTGKTYCSRKKIWTTRAECLLRYRAARATGKNWGEICLECAKVRLWAKDHPEVQEPVKPKTERKKPMNKKKIATDAAPTLSLTVDFTDYPDLLAGLKDSAKGNFRDPEGQILYMVKQHLSGKRNAQK